MQKFNLNINIRHKKWYGLSLWLTLTISLCLLAFSGIVLWLQMNYQHTILLQQEQERSELTANTLLNSLETLMMAGDGYLARDWLNRIAKIPDIQSIQIIRANGFEAFRDLSMIEKVNAFLGQKKFNRDSLHTYKVNDISLEQIAIAMSGKSLDIGNINDDHLTYLLPIHLHESCLTCHNAINKSVIAVLRLTTNLNNAQQRIKNILTVNLIMNITSILFIIIILYWLIFNWIIAPIKQIIIAMQRIAAGEIDTQINLSSSNELGILGTVINGMTANLRHTTVSRNFVNSITDSMLNALFILDCKGIIIAVNPAACELLEYEKDELIGQSIRKVLTSHSQIENFCGGANNQKEIREIEQGFVKKDGIVIPILMSSGPIQGMSGSRVCVVQNLSDYKRMERTIRLSHKGLLDVVMKHHNGIMVVNEIGQVLFANPAARDLLGQELKRLPKSLVDLSSPYRITEIDIIHDQQKQGVAKLIITEIDWENQHAFLIVLDDVTDRKIAEEAMIHMVYHDALTGLPNRIMFTDCITQALVRQRLTGEMLAVFFLDIDRFKIVNDTFGHSYGNQLLQEIGARLQDTVRKGDTVARMGSDEFTILLEGIKKESSIELIARKIMRAFQAPFYIQDNTLYITISIGISSAPHDSDNPETLLQYADTAMHYAKEQGRNQICTYKSDLSNRIANRLTLEQQLREALEKNQLHLFYQPQVNMDSGKLIGLEALLRWNNPEHGLISIGPFVSILEDTGLITQVGAWVLHEACSQLRLWQEQNMQVVPVSVNLSAMQLRNCDIITVVEHCLLSNNIAPHLLGLELTESVIMTNMNEVISLLSLFADQGMILSIDDFGTGYSSLSVLRQIPVHIVKLDRSFVQEITHRAQDAALASAVIAMAHHLGKQVVAEGVETQEQRDFLIKERCDYGQGYLFGYPMPAEKIAILLHELGSKL
jgi:diguanylate cyclase (GGDEF)-like protein/PAS domain S-box-containing protein